VERKARRTRGYASPLRQAQTQETRTRILDALVRTLARGVADFSVPAVAEEAGVSIPTVYRHFPTKRALLEALTGHVEGKLGLGDRGQPRDPIELAALVREAYVRLDAMDDELRAADASVLGQEARRTVDLPARHRAIATALAGVTAPLSEADRRHLLNVVAIIASGHALRAFKEDLGLSAEEAAASAGWAIVTLARLAECIGGSDDD
jgi:AcrR family transcriptional regulator